MSRSTRMKPCGYLARADGKYAFSATMDPHTTRTVEGVKEVMVRLGNAGGVTISLNGKPIGPAGPKGQVRTIQFTSGGFQIVPAKPPGWTRSIVSDGAAVRWRLRSSASNSRRRRFLTLSSTLCQNLAK